MNILIVEDQYSLADAMKATLEKESFNVTVATDGETGEDEALSDVYDLIILDVMLPGKNGFDILRSVKTELDTPVIMVTAKGEIEDKLNGLEHGADDYITKPFHIKELVARVNAVLRRVNRVERVDMPSYGDVTMDAKNSSMICNNSSLTLTVKEYQLMEMLVLHKGNVTGREQIITKIWGWFSDAEYNNVEVYISFLRKKLRLLDSSLRIKTVRGVGYKLEDTND